MRCLAFAAVFLSTIAIGNPYPDPDRVPKVRADFFDPVRLDFRVLSPAEYSGSDVLRVRVDWHDADESFHVANTIKEASGTSALAARSPSIDALGSYRGVLLDLQTGDVVAADALGTGSNYRRLTRALTFRFPWFDEPMEFVMFAENPESGEMEEVLRETVEPTRAESASPARNLEVREMKPAIQSPSLHINVYAEGYVESRRSIFWNDAERVLRVLEQEDLPFWDHIAVRAVFHPSNETLGTAVDLGMPVPVRDSFLGLYFPYWNDFGRWYHVIYPTSEEKFRAGLGLAAYDYPIALVDSSAYWGVGNYKEHTAVPARNTSFAYLLKHEFGHFLGLNEEYEGGGRTELEFAPRIEEPWSQNITFLQEPGALKWGDLVSAALPVPTPRRYWTGSGPIAAYAGGYADSEPRGRSHKPGFSCTMDRAEDFCQVCRNAIRDRIAFDLGLLPAFE